jgi:hypothetical protein
LTRVIRPGFQAVHFVGRLVERGHHDHRQMVGQRVGLQPAAHLEAVHAGHHDIKQHHVHALARADVQGFLATGRRQNLKIFGGKASLQ